MTKVQLQVMQDVIIKHPHEPSQFYSKQIIEREYPGVPAGSDPVSIDLEVDLSEIKFAISGKKKKHGIEKERSPEDLFLASSLQPSSFGKLQKVRTYLRVLPEYDGCTCCSSVPQGAIDMEIVPSIPPTLGAADPSSFDWNPQEVHDCEFEL